MAEKTVVIAGSERKLVAPRGFEASQAVLDAIFALVQGMGGPDRQVGQALNELATQAAQTADLTKVWPLLRAFLKYGLQPAPADDEITPGDCVVAIEALGDWIGMLELDRPFRRGAEAQAEVGGGV